MGSEKIGDPWTHSSLQKPCTTYLIEHFFDQSLCLCAFYGNACGANDCSFFSLEMAWGVP